MYLDPFHCPFQMISSRQNHLICDLHLENTHTREILVAFETLRICCSTTNMTGPERELYRPGSEVLETCDDHLGASGGTGSCLLTASPVSLELALPQSSALYLSRTVHPRRTLVSVCPGMKEFWGHGNFSTKTKEVTHRQAGTVWPPYLTHLPRCQLKDERDNQTCTQRHCRCSIIICRMKEQCITQHRTQNKASNFYCYYYYYYWN